MGEEEVQEKVLKNDEEVHELIKSVVGDRGFEIVKHLFEVRKADEFEIAEELEEEVNFVRSIMYRMYTCNLVNYTRRRDQEKGWYIYTWELEPKKVYNELITRKQSKLDNLFKKMENEEGREQRFYCPECSIELEFPKALDLDFSCFACGGLLEPEQKKAEDLETKTQELSQEIGLLKKRLNEL